jgi:hypothetical protein
MMDLMINIIDIYDGYVDECILRVMNQIER